MNIRVVQKKDVVYKNGQSPIFIRFTHERKNKFISVGISVLPKHWSNERQTIVESHPEYVDLQAQINGKLSEYKRKIQKLEILEIPVTFDNLFETKNKRINCTLADRFEHEISRLESLGKYNSVSKHKVALSLLKQFRAGSIRLDDIDLVFLNDFEVFLRQRGNNDNSIATKFAVFKAIYNKALSEELFIPQSNPFVKFKVGKLWTTTRKRSITKEDIQKIIALEIPYNYRSDYKHLAKDIFLFSYFSAGMNFNDIARLRHRDIINNRLSYLRHKTQKLLSFQLTEQAKEIMNKYLKSDNRPDDYIFPIFNKSIHKTEQQKFNRIVKSLRKINSELKNIGEEIGLQFPLTTYVARHTYATVLKRSGVNIAIISESLGHSDLATTQIYLDSFENSAIDEAMKNLL